MWHEPTQVHRNKTGGTTTGQPTPESCASIPASSIPASQHPAFRHPSIQYGACQEKSVLNMNVIDEK